MEVKVITNNSKSCMLKSLDGHIELTITDNVEEVVSASRDYLMNGWILAADPLAGHRGRPNPYISVILRQNRGSEYIGEDILRVEYLLYIFNMELKNRSYDEKVLDDYREVDFSILLNALKGLDKYIL